MKPLFWVCGLVVFGLASAQAAEKLSATGYGPIRVGFTVNEAEVALGQRVKGGPGPANPNCYQTELSGGHSGVTLMVERGRITQVDVRSSDIQTDKGIHVGDSEQKVRGAYPNLKEGPHQFDLPDNRYLTSWDGGTGLRFDITGKKVDRMIYGDKKTIELVEGCL